MLDSRSAVVRRTGRSHPLLAAARPLVLAHRGGAALAPENTLAAFDNGLALGADGLELDVRFARCGQVIVHHDRTLNRTTSLQGEALQFTADELQRADAGYHFRANGTWPFRGAGVGVPTLAAVLSRYRDVPIVIEMKENHPELAQAVVAVVKAADAVERVCLGAFGLRVLRAARRLEPALATSAAREEVRWALYRSWLRWPPMRPAYAAYQVPETAGRTRVVSPTFVAHAHRARLAVHVWTVDAIDDARRLLGWRVDALITDRPDVIVPLVRSIGAAGSSVPPS
jgi:glycerophosphoryl diester phosphodiesterase